jgi:hypothetical protein
MTTAATPMPQPWDRLSDEPAASYARFLLYRNLGPARTLERAYAAHAGVPEGTKRHRVPGSWRRASAARRWVERSAAWDVAMLSQAGREAVAAFVVAVRQISVRLLAAAADADVRLGSWSQVIQTINILGPHIPAELIRQAAAPKA